MNHVARDVAMPDPTAENLMQLGLDEPVARWLAEYRPRGRKRELWDRTRPLVVASIVQLSPPGRPSAEQYAWALTGIATWAIDQNLTLDPEVFLHPDAVEIYCASLKDGSQNTARAVLRRLGPQLTRKAPWAPAAERIKPRTIAQPYTAAELAALRIDAARQSSPARRQATQAVLALGAGVGLDGRWDMKVTGTDVVRTPAAVLVTVGPPSPRVVPVLVSYEDEVLELAERAGDDILVGGASRGKNKASRAIGRFETGPGRPRLSASRCRSTWLLTHLILGTRLSELVAAAGFKNVSSLDELLPLVPAIDEDERIQMLRGGR